MQNEGVDLRYFHVSDHILMMRKKIHQHFDDSARPVHDIGAENKNFYIHVLAATTMRGL